MMDCDTCTGLIGPYMDGELSSDESAKIEAHLEVCDTCASEFAALGAVNSAAMSVMLTAPPEKFWQDSRNATLMQVNRARPAWKLRSQHAVPRESPGVGFQVLKRWQWAKAAPVWRIAVGVAVLLVTYQAGNWYDRLSANKTANKKNSQEVTLLAPPGSEMIKPSRHAVPPRNYSGGDTMMFWLAPSSMEGSILISMSPLGAGREHAPDPSQSELLKNEVGLLTEALSATIADSARYVPQLAAATYRLAQFTGENVDILASANLILAHPELLKSAWGDSIYSICLEWINMVMQEQ